MDFPSLKSGRLLRILKRKPLCYRVVRQTGSHRWMESSAGYPPFVLSFHEGRDVPPRSVKKVLTKDVGLTPKEAKELI